ncbi:futalosine hydrolase [Calidithermus timidus]|jgi:futalosine hydrolase|uniref:futalosine hydrolase n=1 Tax=Calidithermus timidus TaxID=307124 RepID=UPI00037E4257|nr:futalosine hydrolase [Calidithermus timidus]
MMLLLSPTRFEAAFLKGRKFTFHGRAGLRGEGWVWLESGIGKVNTAMTLAAYAQRHRVGWALLFGIAGAYAESGLQVGDVVLAEREIQADLGIKDGGMKGMGFPTLVVGGPEGSPLHYHNRFPLDKALTAELKATLDLPVRSFLTRDLVSENPTEARELSRKWEADVENMEGAAFAQACLWLGLPGAELRAVSNVAGVRDKAQWRIRQAVEALEAALTQVLR